MGAALWAGGTAPTLITHVVHVLMVFAPLEVFTV